MERNTFPGRSDGEFLELVKRTLKPGQEYYGWKDFFSCLSLDVPKSGKAKQNLENYISRFCVYTVKYINKRIVTITIQHVNPEPLPPKQSGRKSEYRHLSAHAIAMLLKQNMIQQMLSNRITFKSSIKRTMQIYPNMYDSEFMDQYNRAPRRRWYNDIIQTFGTDQFTDRNLMIIDRNMEEVSSDIYNSGKGKLKDENIIVNNYDILLYQNLGTSELYTASLEDAFLCDTFAFMYNRISGDFPVSVYNRNLRFIDAEYKKEKRMQEICQTKLKKRFFWGDFFEIDPNQLDLYVKKWHLDKASFEEKAIQLWEQYKGTFYKRNASYQKKHPRDTSEQMLEMGHFIFNEIDRLKNDDPKGENQSPFVSYQSSGEEYKATLYTTLVRQQQNEKKKWEEIETYADVLTYAERLDILSRVCGSDDALFNKYTKYGETNGLFDL